MPEPHAAGVEDVEAIGIRMTERVIAEVTAYLSAKIDRAFAEMEDRLRGQDGRLDELASTVRVAAATVTKMVADLAEEEPTRPPTPGAPLPRPAALDAACEAAADENGPRIVQVEVYGRTVTQQVGPSSDPAQVWNDLCSTIRDHSEVVAWHN